MRINQWDANVCEREPCALFWVRHRDAAVTARNPCSGADAVGRRGTRLCLHPVCSEQAAGGTAFLGAQRNRRRSPHVCRCAGQQARGGGSVGSPWTALHSKASAQAARETGTAVINMAPRQPNWGRGALQAPARCNTPWWGATTGARQGQTGGGETRRERCARLHTSWLGNSIRSAKEGFMQGVAATGGGERRVVSSRVWAWC